MARAPEWSTIPELIRRLEHRWASGTWLEPYALGEVFEPVTVSVRNPTATDLAERTVDVQRWVSRFRADAARQPNVRVSDKTVRNRSIGANDVPAAIHLDSFGDLVETLGVESDILAFDHAASMTATSVPEASDWVRQHPRKVVANAPIWPQLLSALRWVIDHDVAQLDLRHIDAPGVDSKFLVEQRRLVRPLLDVILPTERVHEEFNDLDKRYGFRPRPTYVRLRTLGNDVDLPSSFTEFELRVDELAHRPLPVANVYVVENRATFNAFPDVADSIVVFGGGYAVSTLGRLDWLHDRNLVYWGDIDTHGFRILSRLRELFPNCTSMLMDEPTLRDHLDRVVDEPAPLAEYLEHLTHDEARLYRDLQEDRYGPAVRLEQERIPLGFLRRQLSSVWTG